MLMERGGFPQEDEIVLASVTKVNPSSVFCVLDHYGKKTGLIHISEISPGRIRNIRDYVIEGKKVVVKVLKVDEEKGHIDLSLRRVTEMSRRAFNDRLKQEQRAEKLLDQFKGKKKLDEKVLVKIVEDIKESYDYVHEFFREIVEENVKAEEVVDKAIAKDLEAFVKEKIQPESVELKASFTLSLYNSDGVELIKKALSSVQDATTSIRYMGAGKYSLNITAKEYKEAEKVMQGKKEALEEFAEKEKGTFAMNK